MGCLKANGFVGVADDALMVIMVTVHGFVTHKTLTNKPNH
jgi:hypothetical protein